MPISTVENPRGQVIGFLDLDASGSDATTAVKTKTRYSLSKDKRFHVSKLSKVDRAEVEAAAGATGLLPTFIGASGSVPIATVAAEAVSVVASPATVDLSA